MEQIMMKQITDQTAEVRRKKSAEQADQQEKRKRKRADQQTEKQGKVENKRKRKDEGMSEEAKQENIRRKKEISSKDVSFSKRRRGLFAKTTEFCMRFDHTKIAIVMLSRAQRPYAFGHPSVDAVLDHYLQQGSSPSSSSSASTSASVTGHKLQQQTHKFEELKAKLKSRKDNKELCGNTSAISSVTLGAVKEQIEKEIKACQTLQELASLRQKYLVLLDKINSRNSSNNSPLLEHHQAADHMAQYNNFATKPIISPDEDHGTIDFNFNGAGGSDKTVNYSNLVNLSFSEDDHDHDHDHVIGNDVEVPPPAANFNGATSYIRQKDPDDRDHCGNDTNSGNGTAWDPDSIVDYIFDNDVEGACWDVEGEGCFSGAASDASFDLVSGFVQQNTDGVYRRTYSELEHLIHNP